jgi:hypothetical protein
VQEHDWVTVEDVEWAAWLCRQTPDREHRAYRNHLIARCYEQGNTTFRQLAAFAELSERTIHRIRRARWPHPDLRVVRSGRH